MLHIQQLSLKRSVREMNNQIYLFEFYAVIISDSLNTDKHSHLAHQLTFSLNDESFEVEVGEELINSKVVFIPSQEEHKFLGSCSQFLSILIDNESLFNLSELRAKLCDLDTFPTEIGDVEPLLKHLGLGNGKNLDSRVIKVKEMIDSAEFLEEIRLSEISNEISLSESRMLHLFKEQVGVPLRKYILWKKLRRAISSFASNKKMKLTDIALGAGFSDSAHLSKVIKASFGLSPSEILKNSQFIKDHN